jgi:hypothetical protein
MDDDFIGDVLLYLAAALFICAGLLAVFIVMRVIQ